MRHSPLLPSLRLRASFVTPAAATAVAIVALAATAAGTAAAKAKSSAHRHPAHAGCVAAAHRSAAAHRRAPRGRSLSCARRPTRRGPLTATPIDLGGVPAGQPLPTGAAATAAFKKPAPAPKPTRESTGPGPGNLSPESGETVSDPIDSRFLTDVPFGDRSFWLQPWRAYLDTSPASRLTESLGINFPENPALAEDTAQLLQDSGFKLARMSIGWSALSYEEPSTILASHVASITARLTAMRRHGLRPLIVLNANSQAPAPELQIHLETVSEAPAGATTVTLTAASAARVVPGRTGFNNLTWEGSPDVLVTKVGAGGLATLSSPLRKALPAGSHAGTTLRFAPFPAPRLAGGAPNPVFRETLAGWLAYVGAVNKLAASVVGAGGYDLEVWNELTFGSQFLNSENYYSSAAAEAEPELGLTPGLRGTEAEQDALAEANVEEQNDAEAEDEGAASEASTLENAVAAVPAASPSASVKSVKNAHTKEVTKAILSETVSYVRNSANGISPAVGITDGFASQTPFPSGSAAPLGMTALSKHPYVGAKQFPAELHKGRIRSIHALGGRDTSSPASFEALFVPSFQSDFPEYTLNVTSTETSIRDLAPFTTTVYGFPHGREVGPGGGHPVQKWITEYNLSSRAGHTVGPDGVTPASGEAATLTSADKAHFQAKVALRSLVANVAKGFTREYFYKAAPGALSLVGEGFFSAAEAHPGTYPGDGLGGETMSGLRNLLGQFQGPGPGGAARQLELRSIAQSGNHAQFAGDGSIWHPSLYDRDVLAVFPFQSSPTHFVIPVYVMTRDLRTLYQPSAPATDIHRFDLPDESFRITLANLPASASPPSVSAYDPLRDTATPARLVSREGTSATFEVAASDSPRLLSLDYTGA